MPTRMFFSLVLIWSLVGCTKDPELTRHQSPQSVYLDHSFGKDGFLDIEEKDKFHFDFLGTTKSHEVIFGGTFFPSTEKLGTSVFRLTANGEIADSPSVTRSMLAWDSNVTFIHPEGFILEMRKGTYSTTGLWKGLLSLPSGKGRDSFDLEIPGRKDDGLYGICGTYSNGKLYLVTVNGFAVIESEVKPAVIHSFSEFDGWPGKVAVAENGNLLVTSSVIAKPSVSRAMSIATPTNLSLQWFDSSGKRLESLPEIDLSGYDEVLDLKITEEGEILFLTVINGVLMLVRLNSNGDLENTTELVTMSTGLFKAVFDDQRRIIYGEKLNDETIRIVRLSKVE